MTATRPVPPTPELLGGLLDALPEPAVLIDAGRRIVAANAAFAAGLARRRTEIVGRTCHEVLHGRSRPCDPTGHRCPLEACRAGEAACRVVHVHDGERGPHHVEVRLRSIPDRSDEREHFLGVLAPVPFASVEPRREGLVGRSEAFNRVLAEVRLVADGDAPVLVVGEPGTGKQTIARTIHDVGPRARGPFVCFDATGVSEARFDRELLGEADGSGLIAAAAGGTLCLADVDALPPALQSRLLRALESGGRGGREGGDPREAAFRTIATSTRDLDALVRDGAFRRELRLRIAAITIAVPPLRERPEDIAPLAESLLRRFADPRRPAPRLHPATLRRLAALELPGNVRELRGVLERAWVLAEGGEILPRHLAGTSGAAPEAGIAFRGEVVPLAEAERGYIAWALSRFDDGHAELARRLGISLRTLYRKLEASRPSGDD